MNGAYLILVISLFALCESTSASEDVARNDKTIKIIGPDGLLTKFLSWYRSSARTENTFIGRCLGMARKLKMTMPLIIFSMGVIVTTLTFLSVFALKTLGLLMLLVVMNTSGIASKLTLWKTELHGKGHKPQNVHVHVHQTKDGLYGLEHPGYGSWHDRKSILTGNDADLNIYDPYRR